MTQAQLAKLLGTSQSAVARMEEGQVQAADMQVIDAAAKRTIAGKIVNDAFALIFIFGRGGRLFGGREMGRHCPSD